MFFVGLSVFGVWKTGPDLVTGSLAGATGIAAALGCWSRFQHVAHWLAGGVAAVSGALLTLILDAAMSGSSEDPSTVPIVISFAGAASVSAVLHVRMTELQAERERHVDRALAALASRKDLAELEARLVARHETATDVHGSWRVWWRSRPRSR